MQRSQLPPLRGVVVYFAREYKRNEGRLSTLGISKGIRLCTLLARSGYKEEGEEEEEEV